MRKWNWGLFFQVVGLSLLIFVGGIQWERGNHLVHAQLAGSAGFQYRKITTSVCTQIIGSTGQLHEIFVSSPGTTWTIQVFDNAAACSGTAIIGATAITVPAAGTVWQFDIQANSGIAVLTSGATPGELTVAFR